MAEGIPHLPFVSLVDLSISSSFEAPRPFVPPSVAPDQKFKEGGFVVSSDLSSATVTASGESSKKKVKQLYKLIPKAAPEAAKSVNAPDPKLAKPPSEEVEPFATIADISSPGLSKDSVKMPNPFSPLLDLDSLNHLMLINSSWICVAWHPSEVLYLSRVGTLRYFNAPRNASEMVGGNFEHGATQSFNNCIASVDLGKFPSTGISDHSSSLVLENGYRHTKKRIGTWRCFITLPLRYWDGGL
ncbi:hypothetical protein Nepgr_013896 [Nepenthes gracilis]|uniref:Uncharacterized protein n=1 Tax=Nepenthes gracilis TaxID=150966 RepID=A0AAD3SJN0_NEPGR|nr:hypothetical protein Nepgr_013896 [Nepenthes gracilis]